MVRKETNIKGAYILFPKIYKDERGYFYESYNQKSFNALGIDQVFVQDNEAKSTYGVIRGLHFQMDDYAQAKLVRVSQGKVLDVILDLRKDSTTYGHWIAVVLSAVNKNQLLIPRGLAHGYAVLSKTAVFNYKCDNYYSPAHEAGVNPLDPKLNIDWKIPIHKMIISAKDQKWPNF